MDNSGEQEFRELVEEHVVHVCAAPNGGDTYREVWPLRWSSGLSTRNQAGILHVCVGNGSNYPPDGYFWRASKRAVKWAPGVKLNLPAGIEVGLESVSGFSRWVRVRYDFGSRLRHHQLCGSGGRDESVAGRIFSGAGRAGT